MKPITIDYDPSGHKLIAVGVKAVEFCGRCSVPVSSCACGGYPNADTMRLPSWAQEMADERCSHCQPVTSRAYPRRHPDHCPDCVEGYPYRPLRTDECMGFHAGLDCGGVVCRWNHEDRTVGEAAVLAVVPIVADDERPTSHPFICRSRAGDGGWVLHHIPRAKAVRDPIHFPNASDYDWALMCRVKETPEMDTTPLEPDDEPDEKPAWLAEEDFWRNVHAGEEERPSEPPTAPPGFFTHTEERLDALAAQVRKNDLAITNLIEDRDRKRARPLEPGVPFMSRPVPPPPPPNRRGDAEHVAARPSLMDDLDAIEQMHNCDMTTRTHNEDTEGKGNFSAYTCPGCSKIVEAVVRKHLSLRRDGKGPVVTMRRDTDGVR